MNQHSRRDLLSFFSHCLAFYSLSKLSSCGPRSSQSSLLLEGKEVKDIQTHVQGSRGFRGSILKAKDIAAGREVTLYVDEGSHKHPFKIGPKEYAELIAGRKVQMVTERVSGHTHTMVIDPSYNPRNADSARIEAAPQDQTETPKVALEGDGAVRLHVSQDQSSKPPQYCIGSEALCRGNSNNWTTMQASNKYRVVGKKLYNFTSDPTEFEGKNIYLYVTQNGKSITRSLKVTR